ncbi:ABC transporter permease [Vallicoccus soli]|uniref:ABC transporter permease n=1 Tax=Vallicoccus soli TaxID=2339232 RepID=A0A3A3YTT1_9ACTN|nr:ABC transporter permease [Vallicoccus soli]RJK94894.1 ABC transporter permease [Vallicoccus soli]
MSTTTTAPGGPTGAAAAARRHTGPSLATLAGVELRKTVDTRAGRWLLVVTGLLVVAAVAVMLFAAEPQELTFEDFASIAQLPLALLLPVIGILGVTSEWSQRTALTTFALVPRRLRVVGAKVLAAVALAVLAWAFSLLAAAVGNALAPAVDGDGSWDVGSGLLWRVLLLQVVNVLVGVGFGLLLQNSAVAIVSFFLIPTLVTVVASLVGPFEDIAPWVDFNQASTPIAATGEPSGEQWAQFGTASLLWAGATLVLGALRVQRREVS